MRELETTAGAGMSFRISKILQKGVDFVQKYSSRGTKPECPLESAEFWAGKDQSRNVADNTQFILTKPECL
jgi:hypothetical protein